VRKSSSRSGSLPAENVAVFDANAIIALLDDEPGAEVVEEILEGEDHRCLVHVLNVCEVYYHIYRRAGKERAAKLEKILESYGFEFDDSLLPELWQEAGRLKAEWRRVSLADCFALALARQRQAALVTSDHHELDPIAEAGVCPLRFIR
jgi:uncharacterized protein with PIN domain